MPADKKEEHVETAAEFCQRTIEGFKKKADHNKRESLNCFLLVVVATLATPLFIMLGEGEFLGRIVPSVMSLTAAGATTWLQLRKPQRLWVLYRTCQRELEDRQSKYRFLIGDYTNEAKPDKKLAEDVARIAFGSHGQWVQMVPAPEDLQGMTLGRLSKPNSTEVGMEPPPLASGDGPHAEQGSA